MKMNLKRNNYLLIIILWIFSMILPGLAIFRNLSAIPGVSCKSILFRCIPYFEGCYLEARAECNYWCEYLGSDCLRVRYTQTWCQIGSPCDCCSSWELICQNGLISYYDCCEPNDQCNQQETK